MTIDVLITFLIICLICIIETGSQICFKSVISKLEKTQISIKEMFKLTWRLLFVLRIWIGLWLGLFGLALWIIVLSKEDLNFVYCLSSIHYVFIAAASQFVLKEKVSKRRWLATLLITVGIAVVSFTGG